MQQALCPACSMCLILDSFLRQIPWNAIRWVTGYNSFFSVFFKLFLKNAHCQVSLRKAYSNVKFHKLSMRM